MSAPVLRCLSTIRKINSACAEKARCVLEPRRGYAKKLAAPLAAKKAKSAIEVETDAEKLTTHCCGLNYFKEGEDPQLKPDSEYPEWLWTLRTERTPVPMEELDPMTWQYWRRVKKMHILRDNKLASMRFKKPGA